MPRRGQFYDPEWDTLPPPATGAGSRGGQLENVSSGWTYDYAGNLVPYNPGGAQRNIGGTDISGFAGSLDIGEFLPPFSDALLGTSDIGGYNFGALPDFGGSDISNFGGDLSLGGFLPPSTDALLGTTDIGGWLSNESFQPNLGGSDIANFGGDLSLGEWIPPATDALLSLGGTSGGSPPQFQEPNPWADLASGISPEPTPIPFSTTVGDPFAGWSAGVDPFSGWSAGAFGGAPSLTSDPFSAFGDLFGAPPVMSPGIPSDIGTVPFDPSSISSSFSAFGDLLGTPPTMEPGIESPSESSIVGSPGSPSDFSAAPDLGSPPPGFGDLVPPPSIPDLSGTPADPFAGWTAAAWGGAPAYGTPGGLGFPGSFGGPFSGGGVGPQFSASGFPAGGMGGGGVWATDYMHGGVDPTSGSSPGGPGGVIKPLAVGEGSGIVEEEKIAHRAAAMGISPDDYSAMLDAQVAMYHPIWGWLNNPAHGSGGYGAASGGISSLPRIWSVIGSALNTPAGVAAAPAHTQPRSTT